MIRKTIVLFTCLVLAFALVTSVGCNSKDGSTGSGPSGSVSGFPFVKIGANYSFFVVNGAVQGRVEKDLGNGWIVTDKKEFINLNAIMFLEQINGGR